MAEGARRGASDCQILGRSNIATATQEGRNAVHLPQTRSQTGPTATTWTKRGPRRVPPRSNRPKPPETSQAGPDAAARSGLRNGRPRRYCGRISRRPTSSTESARNGHYHRRVDARPVEFATLRAHSIKRSANGVSDRSLTLMNPTGRAGSAGRHHPSQGRPAELTARFPVAGDHICDSGRQLGRIPKQLSLKWADHRALPR
jgi:hypothetical protein